MPGKLSYTDQSGQRHTVTIGIEQPVITIGRMADCQIRVMDTSVSRRHSQVTYSRVGADDVYEMVDLGSSNGSFVNDQKIQRSRLNSNDALRCGNFHVGFVIEAAAMAAGPAMPGGHRAGPPAAGAPTRMGPMGSAGHMQMGPPPSAPPPSVQSSSAPYLDDPSIAISPEQLASMPPLAGMAPPSTGPPTSVSGAPAYHPPPMAPSPRPSGPPPSSPPRHYNEPPRGQEMDDLRRENERLRSGSGYGDYRRYEGDASHYRDEVHRLREENEDLRREDERGRAQMDALTDRNVELKEQFTALQETQGDLRDKLREAREDLDNALFKRDGLGADVERLEADKVELFDQLTKLKIEFNHMERSHEQTQKDHNLLEFEYKRLDETNQQLERELTATLEGDDAQADAFNKLQAIVDDKEELISELRDRIDDLKEDLTAAEEDNEWLVEVETLKNEVESLKTENEALFDQKSDVVDKLSSIRASAESDNEERDEDLQLAQDELERLRRRLKDRVTPEAYASVSQENDGLRSDVTALKRQLDEVRDATPSDAGELLSQIRELTNENHRLEAKIRDQLEDTSTSDGSKLPVVSGVPKDLVRGVFDSMNGTVSGWRANLETMQIHVGDLTEFCEVVDRLLKDGALDDSSKTTLKTAHDKNDPNWAVESIGETVKQILSDSRKVKSKLLELRDELK